MLRIFHLNRYLVWSSLLNPVCKEFWVLIGLWRLFIFRRGGKSVELKIGFVGIQSEVSKVGESVWLFFVGKYGLWNTFCRFGLRLCRLFRTLKIVFEFALILYPLRSSQFFCYLSLRSEVFFSSSSERKRLLSSSTIIFVKAFANCLDAL